MKKKIMSVLLASTIAVTALGLTACNDDGDEKGDVLKSEKVSSAEAWAAAFDFSEVTNATLNWKAISEERTSDRTVKLDGQKSLTIKAYDDYYDEYYCDYKPDEQMMWEVDGEMYGTLYYYSYDEYTEEWSVEKQAAFDGDNTHSFLHEIDEIDNDGTPYRISESFSYFTYDEKNYEYVAVFNETIDNNTFENCKVTIKIKDGKIAEGGISGTYKYKDDEETITMTFKVYDVGTTKVTLPKVGE